MIEKKKEYSIFYDNGVRKLKGEYINNIKNGVFKGYYITGNTEYEGFYKDGVKDGVWTFYSNEGKITKTILYKKGEILQEKIYSEEIIILKE